ncbi:MAG: replication initiator protein [Microviridae sp.]|nr:MAG: replication initiator protein [Microviridae sp.]
MACYKPIEAYRGLRRTKNGKLPVVFDRRESNGQAIKLPCGRCIGCRIDHSRAWAVRCVHEAQMHDDNSFITLTYNTENLPGDNGLCIEHFQKFMKRLRKAIAPKKIRFFHCGEYGEQLSRPHYHSLIFGYAFPDRMIWKKDGDFAIYRSPQLEMLWPFGFSTIAECNFETAAYVSRYVLKKQNGEKAESHYRKVDPETGEEFQIQPEYITMSRNKGIAYKWFEKYGSDVFPSDEVILQGKKLKTPEYYSRLFEEREPERMVPIVKARKERAQKYKKDNTRERLDTRHKVAKQRLKNLHRTYEKGES